MKITELFIIIFCNFVIFVKSKITCGVDKIKSNTQLISENNNINIVRSKKRKTSNEEDYKPIRIYLSNEDIKTKIIYLKAFGYNENLLNRIILCLDNTKSYIEKLVNVRRRIDKIIMTSNEQLSIVSISDNSLENGINADLLIIPTYTLDKSEINIENYKRDEETNRVIISKLNIPVSYLNQSNITQFEVETLLLHEITHILGFQYESYQYFPGGINNVIKDKIDFEGRKKYYIITPTVVKLAKEYFGCDTLIGLELENQDNINNNIPSSHWESRILLGEYMNLEQYTPEVVISDFTLALLEDSGWYKVNYYTGGLMRFGKNKGCDFLNKDCLNNNKETYFKNEFFGKSDINNPSCSSGRLSRTYNLVKNYQEITDIGGMFKNADYCYIFYYQEEEEKISQYIGNCKRGKGNYGSMIEYKDYNNNIINLKNGELENELGEVYSDNSFCVLSEVYNSYSNNMINFTGIIHPICYEMFCSETTLTIKIKEQYITCPREGGKIKVYNNSNFNLQGYIFCPDYNLICTGTVVCNDIFDCITKESKSLSPNYTYIVSGDTSSQKISEIKNSPIMEGYELSLSKGICPINCAQCDINKKCTKCRNGYNIIVLTEQENNPTICDNNNIDINKGYYLYDNAYYPCFEFCEKCKNDISCEKCDNLHVLNKNKTICFNAIENCDIYDDNNFSCQKCINGYAFLKTERRKCQNDIVINKENYFSLDEGISYYPCDTNVKNCEKCNNKNNSCIKCNTGFYFLENNRTFCFSGINLTKYYTNDSGISYLLCNKTIPNCEKCSKSNDNNNLLKCDLCEKNYYFIEEKRDKCYTNFSLEQYYTEDNGISYYSCDSKYFPKCEKCYNNKNKCEKCIQNYYFIGNNKNKCEYIPDSELNKYFSEDNNISYYLCNNIIDACEQCTNRTHCSKCSNNFYFLENIKNKCYELDLSHYYKQDEAYFPCNKSILNCDICVNKTICALCSKNYYFFGDDRTQCINNLNLKKYYSLDNGISYYSCSNNIQYCDECGNDKICNICLSNYYFKDNDRTKCYLESEIYADKKYYKYNDTTYLKCSDNILHCETCTNDKECETCFKGYYFVDDDNTKCINMKDIDQEKYYLYDEYNYHICSTLINNCEKCNNTHCLLCKEKYTLVNNDYKNCYPTENYKSGYYLDKNKNMVFNCIENCEICENDIQCIKCSGNYTPFASGSFCDSCLSYVINIKDEKLSRETIKYLIQEYINDYKKNYATSVLYTNPNMNYSLLIYRAYQCTELFFKENYFQVNTKELEDTLKKRFNKNINYFIYYMVIYNYQSFLGVYDSNENIYYDLEKECPNCMRNEYEIKNNYIFETNNLLGEVLSKKVSEYNLNILNSSEPYFNDICYNMNFENIDIPLEHRRNIFYFGYFLNRIACLGNDCNIIDISYENNLAECKCKFNFNLNKLNIEKNNSTEEININGLAENKTFDNFKSISDSNPFPIFTCQKESFNLKNIKSNIGFFIGIILIIIQFISFLVLIINFCLGKNFIKKLENNDIKEIKEIIASPPIKDLILYKKNQKSKEDPEQKIQDKDMDISYDLNDNADEIKQIQDKDEDEEEYEYDDKENFFENENTNYLNSEININTIMNNTQLFTDENNLLEFNSEQRGKSGIFLTQKKNSKFNFDLGDTNLEKFSDKITGSKYNIKNLKSYYNNNSNNNNKGIDNRKSLDDSSKNDKKEPINYSKDSSSNMLNENNDLKNTNDLLIGDNNTKNEKIEDNKNSVDNPENIQKNSNNLLIKIKKNKNNNSRNSSNTNLNNKKIDIKNKEDNMNSSKNTKDLLLINKKTNNINSSNNLNNSSQNRKKTLEEQIEKENNNSKSIKRNSSQSNSSLITNSEDESITSFNKKIKKILQYDFMTISESRKKDKRSFCDVYCNLLILKQPILNLLSDINALELNKSFVPFSMKVIRFLFFVGLNLFLNSLFLTQKYFIKKYNYFNAKYLLEQTEENYGKINKKEIFIFALKNCLIYSIICFIIILCVQFLVNYIFFNLRRKIWKILKLCNDEKNEEIKEINIFMVNYNKYYLIIGSINFILMMIFFYYLVNFSQAYKGGYIDFLTGGFITWIFLQIFPFITCFISSIFRFCGIKKGYSKLYKLNQVYAF